MTHDQQTTRMTPAAFEQWCRALALSPSTRDYLATIRGRPPVRRVTSRAGNVSGTYPSRKMGVTIQFESHKEELWAILVMDHDPEVLEFFDQPDSFKLRYPGTQAGKMQGHYYTPDFLVLRKGSACLVAYPLLRVVEIEEVEVESMRGLPPRLLGPTSIEPLDL